MTKKQFVVLTLLFALLLPGSATAISLGKKINLFSGKDLNGNNIDMHDVVGNKPVMLIFWASWCPNCKKEVPKINKLYEKYSGRGMDFIGINVGFNDSESKARAFINQTGMMYPVIFDKRGRISKQFSIQGVPTIIVTNRQGIVRFKNYGLPTMTEKDFKELLIN